MSIVIAQGIHQKYGSRHVLRGVSLSIAPGDRLGLIGPNGEGKTTLLRIIGGDLVPTEGEVHRRKNLRMGYLPQVLPELSDTTVHGAMMAAVGPVLEMERQLQSLAERLAVDDGGDALDRYGRLQAEFESRGGHSYHLRIEQVLTGLGFDRSMWDRPLSQLSGGQRTRVYLATLLLDEPDLLMLDEPTNHLDLEAVEWLEYWLKSFRGALIVVSHDRYFLDSVTNDTLETAFGDVEKYHGSYSSYLKQRAQRYKERFRRWEAQQEYIRETRDFIAQHLAGQRTKEAQGRRTRLERFMRDEAIDRPQEHQAINLKLSCGGRTGDMVLRAGGLVAGYSLDVPLVKIEKLEVLRGNRIAIVGPNGSGKTTLLRTLLGQIEPLEGSIKTGAGVRVGYLSQTHAELGENDIIIEAVQRAAAGVTEQQARSALARALIQGDEVFKRAGQLSGGQRSRVLLVCLMLREPNVLALDEPTNHLDIPSREIIEQLLQDFDGTVLMVSHDRFLIDAVAEEVWALDDGVVQIISGGWASYVQWRATVRDQQAVARSAGAAHGRESVEKQRREQGRRDRKAEYREARKQAGELQRRRSRHEALEGEIESIELKLAELNEQVSAAGQARDLEQVERLGRQYEELSEQLHRLWDEWATLGESLE